MQSPEDETLDADRFGIWLEVLMESGASVAAAKLTAAMNTRGCLTVDPTAFDFISSNAQLALIREFLDTLAVRS